MHYVEDNLPWEIRSIFSPSDEVNRIYPPEQWMIETGHPPVKAWYTIQNTAVEKGLTRQGFIGSCKVMSFKIWDVVSICERELKRDPFGLYGLTKEKR